MYQTPPRGPELTLRAAAGFDIASWPFTIATRYPIPPRTSSEEVAIVEVTSIVGGTIRVRKGRTPQGDRRGGVRTTPFANNWLGIGCDSLKPRCCTIHLRATTNEPLDRQRGYAQGLALIRIFPATRSLWS
jgi:hypothetical protein